MWIFTRWGFFSCVCARQGDGDAEESVDRQQLMIRARTRVHLETLQSRLPDWSASVKSRNTPMRITHIGFLSPKKSGRK